jgi:hypothetical protein
MLSIRKSSFHVCFFGISKNQSAVKEESSPRRIQRRQKGLWPYLHFFVKSDKTYSDWKSFPLSEAGDSGPLGKDQISSRARQSSAAVNSRKVLPIF